MLTEHMVAVPTAVTECPQCIENRIALADDCLGLTERLAAVETLLDERIVACDLSRHGNINRYLDGKLFAYREVLRHVRPTRKAETAEDSKETK